MRRWKRPFARIAIGVAVVVGAVVGYRLWILGWAPAEGPLIGVSADIAWHSRLGLSVTTYEVALTRAGARVLVFRPEDGTAEQLLGRLDGLLLAGGGDIDPVLHPGAGAAAAHLVDRERDEFELQLIEGALERDMPVLGLCRGIQILNVAHGGTVRDLRDDPALGPAHGGRLDWPHEHEVTVEPGSRMAAMTGAGTRTVNSFHGQAVGRLGDSLMAAATAPDGVVEAVERRDRRYVVALQWHPEILSLTDPAELAVFEALVHAAGSYRSRRER